MADSDLTVIDNPTDEERLWAFAVPADGPMVRRSVEPRLSAVHCGGCGRVVAAAMTLLDLWEAMSRPIGRKRLLWRCTCGAHLLVPAKGEYEPLTVEGLADGSQTFKRANPRGPRRAEPDLRRG